MSTTLTRRAVVATAIAACLLGGAACGGDDEGAGSGTTTTAAGADGTQPSRTSESDGNDADQLLSDFDPETDDPYVALCDGYFTYVETGDLAAIETVNLAADVIGDLDAVRDASFFLLENPEPAEEDQTQAEDALAILQSDIEDAGLCDDVPSDDESGAESEEEGDITVAMCGEWADFEATGDAVSIGTLLSNAEDIGLSPEAVDALLVLSDPDADQDLHEGALAVADEGFSEIC